MGLPPNVTASAGDVMRHGWVLGMPSNVANVINFVVFDIVLITVVFAGTSLLAGLFNDRDLCDRQAHQLHIFMPPVVGGGLCGTHRGRSYLLAFIRIMGLALVLLSNACIEGAELPDTKKIVRRMLLPGPVRGMSAERIRKSVKERAGCKVLEADDEGRRTEWTIYGDLRFDDNDELQCVAEQHALDKPLKVGRFALVQLSTGKCEEPVERSRIKVGADTKVIEMGVNAIFCEHATLRCMSYPDFMTPNSTQLVLQRDTCRGIVRNPTTGATYVVEDQVTLSSWLEENATYVEALAVQNLDYKAVHWMDTVREAHPVQTTLDDILAMYAARTGRRAVLEPRTRSVTYLSPGWVVVLALKALIALALMLRVAHLLHSGYRPVAHDEHGLTVLIANGIDDGALTLAARGCAAPSDSDGSLASSARSEIRLATRSASDKWVVFARGYAEKEHPNQKYIDYEAQYL